MKFGNPWTTDSTIFKRIYLGCRDRLRAGPANWTPTYKDRMILLTIGQFVNWFIGIYGLVVRPSNFASFILAIFIINLFLYMAFYIIVSRFQKCFSCFVHLTNLISFADEVTTRRKDFAGSVIFYHFVICLLCSCFVLFPKQKLFLVGEWVAFIHILFPMNISLNY